MNRILILEDMAILRNEWKELFSDDGYYVILATNGRQGLEKLVEKPDIILCDYNMPIMDGYQFCVEIKTNHEYVQYSSVPIIGIGGFPINKREYLHECIEKPFFYDDLCSCIKTVWNRTS